MPELILPESPEGSLYAVDRSVIATRLILPNFIAQMPQRLLREIGISVSRPTFILNSDNERRTGAICANQIAEISQALSESHDGGLETDEILTRDTYYNLISQTEVCGSKRPWEIAETALVRVDEDIWLANAYSGGRLARQAVLEPGISYTPSGESDFFYGNDCAVEFMRSGGHTKEVCYLSDTRELSANPAEREWMKALMRNSKNPNVFKYIFPRQTLSGQWIRETHWLEGGSFRKMELFDEHREERQTVISVYVDEGVTSSLMDVYSTNLDGLVRTTAFDIVNDFNASFGTLHSHLAKDDLMSSMATTSFDGTRLTFKGVATKWTEISMLIGDDEEEVCFRGTVYSGEQISYWKGESVQIHIGNSQVLSFNIASGMIEKVEIKPNAGFQQHQ